MKKISMAAVAVVLVTSLAFASEVLSTKIEPGMPYYDTNDYPETLVMKGVAVKDSTAVSAVFLAVDREGGTFAYQSYYLLLNGKAVELDSGDVTFDKKTGTLVATFDSESGALKLVIQHHRINYYNTVTASGIFGDYLLNMKPVGNDDQLYRILEPRVYEENAETVKQVAGIVAQKA
ncbi:MAG: hypothetical protein HYY37_07045 [Candidatus Aenigmarchaeota archaeon]|nr:hypothetical protein [Candidatus Aenigmarchaeota archaeon]